MEGLGRHRPVPLGHEDVRGRPLFALQTPQGAYLLTLHRVKVLFDFVDHDDSRDLPSNKVRAVEEGPA
jgi:hypothetical protein